MSFKRRIILFAAFTTLASSPVMYEGKTLRQIVVPNHQSEDYQITKVDEAAADQETQRVVFSEVKDYMQAQQLSYKQLDTVYSELKKFSSSTLNSYDADHDNLTESSIGKSTVDLSNYASSPLNPHNLSIDSSKFRSKSDGYFAWAKNIYSHLKEKMQTHLPSTSKHHFSFAAQNPQSIEAQVTDDIISQDNVQTTFISSLSTTLSQLMAFIPAVILAGFIIFIMMVFNSIVDATISALKQIKKDILHDRMQTNQRAEYAPPSIPMEAISASTPEKSLTQQINEEPKQASESTVSLKTTLAACDQQTIIEMDKQLLDSAQVDGLFIEPITQGLDFVTENPSALDTSANDNDDCEDNFYSNDDGVCFVNKGTTCFSW